MSINIEEDAYKWLSSLGIINESKKVGLNKYEISKKISNYLHFLLINS
jgi:hypothetical protein